MAYTPSKKNLTLLNVRKRILSPEVLVCYTAIFSVVTKTAL